MKKIKLLTLILLIIVGACEKVEIKPIFEDSVTAIVIDKNNTKWIGTNRALYKTAGDAVTEDDAVITTGVLSLLYEENNNTLWVGTSNGLLKLSIDGSDINNTTNISSELLSDSIMRCMYLETEARLWFGTDTGITMNENDIWKNDSFRVNVLNRIFTMNAENLSINSITSWKGDVYFATQGGSIYRGKQFNEELDAFTGESQLVAPYNGQNTTNNMNVVFVDSKNQIWMGGEKGVQVHVGDDTKNGYTYFNSELPDSIVHVITEAPNGNIWVGTEKGIAVMEGTNWKTTTEGLPDLFITAIAFDKTEGTAWVGTKKGITIIK